MEQFHYLLNEVESAAQDENPNLTGYADKRNALIEHLAKLNRDAERYRWLRENCGYSGSGNHTGAQVIVYYADAGDGKYGIAYTGPTQRVGIMALDYAIDAAMKGANN